MATVLGYLLIILTITYLIPWLIVKRWIKQRDRYDEIHFVRSADDRRLALYRYLPSKSETGLHPVLLLHGMSASHYNMDFMSGASLADYLRKQGYDTFTVDFRGCGLSDKPGWSPDADNYNFDNYIDKDLPAFIAKITKLTGSDKIHLIGHSMGGMSIYAYLGKHGDAKVRSATIVASPAFFPSPKPEPFYNASRKLEPVFRKWPLFHFRTWSVFSLPYSWLYFKSPANNVSNPHNWNLLDIFNFTYYTASNFPRGLLNQSMDWIASGHVHSLDRQINYTADISKVKTPAMVIAATHDRLVPLHLVKKTFELLPEGNKKWLQIEQNDNFRYNYGHTDLLMSRNAAYEVYPEILTWLAENGGN